MYTVDKRFAVCSDGVFCCNVVYSLFSAFSYLEIQFLLGFIPCIDILSGLFVDMAVSIERIVYE